MEIRKAALRLLVASIVVSGVLAIWALLVGEFGRLQAQVLLSSLATSGASILGMACGAAWDRERWPRVALTGIALAGATLALSLIAIWWEPAPIDFWAKLIGTGWLFSAASAHASLLGLARVDAGLARIRDVAVGLGYLLAAGMALTIWRPALENDTGYLRGLGVFGVLMLMGSLSVPILGRLRGLGDEVAEAPPVETSRVMCPSCGHVQESQLGSIACEACARRFRVTLES